MQLSIRAADFADPRDAAAIIDVLDSYATDPIGGGRPLRADVRARLVPALREHPTSLVLLAFAGAKPIGIAVCFFGFSTFEAKPLLNIHDLAVLPAYRGKGVGRALLTEVENRARAGGCCKLSLEVQDANSRARTLYARFGFRDYVINDSPTRYLTKPVGE
jgi:ribosomal protein S18 acetylase RimI-like enzyme